MWEFFFPNWENMQPGSVSAVVLKTQLKVPLMRNILKIAGLALLAASISASGAQAGSRFLQGWPNVSPTNYPGAPKPVYDQKRSPYAMNYAEEAVQTLGFRDGHMDVFSTKPAKNASFMPTFSGGIGSSGAMLKLQWRSGD